MDNLIFANPILGRTHTPHNHSLLHVRTCGDVMNATSNSLKIVKKTPSIEKVLREQANGAKEYQWHCFDKIGNKYSPHWDDHHDYY